jgi:hypothetical protein
MITLRNFFCLIFTLLISLDANANIINIELSGLATSQDDYGLFGVQGTSYTNELAKVLITIDMDLAPSDSDIDTDYGLYQSSSINSWLTFSVEFRGVNITEIQPDVYINSNVWIFDTWETGVLYEFLRISSGVNNGVYGNGEPISNTPNTNHSIGEGFSLDLSTLADDIVFSDSLGLSSFGSSFIEHPSTSTSFTYQVYENVPDGSQTGKRIASKISLNNFDTLKVSVTTVDEPPTIYLISLLLFFLAIRAMLSYRKCLDKTEKSTSFAF